MTPSNNSTEIPTATRPDAAADLAHALCGPLEGLLALGELLQQQPLADAANAQVAAIMDAGRRMARLLDDALDIRDAAAAPDPEPVGLRDLIGDVEAYWRAKPQGGGPRVLISCNTPADLRVIADPSRLRRLLNTVIADVFDANGWGGIELQLHAGLEGDSVVLTGRLEAPGSAFGAQGGSASELCAVLARQMDGAYATGRSDGAGVLTTFELRLKRAGADLASEADAPCEDGPLPPRTHLLIVDDNATNRIVAAALCDMFGCTSETAEDGLEAVEAVKSRPFDLVLMDIKMPRMDGLEATRAIRALPGPVADIPIVALTANADAEATATYLAAGMQAVVDKPIKPERLLATLQWALCGDERGMAPQVYAA